MRRAYLARTLAGSLGPWTDRAACRDTGVEFFGASDDNVHRPGASGVALVEQPWETRAKAVCATCPVRAECLHHALTRPERYGVFGGTTAGERARMLTDREAS